MVHAGSEEERLAIAATLNADRRQMTDAQRLILGMALEDRLAELARQRQAHGLTAPGKNALRQVSQSVRRTTDHVAETVGLGSGRTYERGSRLVVRARQVAPDVAECMAGR